MKRQWKRQSSVHPLKAAARREVLHRRRDIWDTWDMWAFEHPVWADIEPRLRQIDDRLNEIVTPFGVSWTR